MTEKNTDRLSDLSTMREILSRHGFTFSKALGQNFLINPSVCPRMAELGGAAPGTGMIEIGAGIGVLTAELAKRADKVVCVEIDSRLLPILDETLGEFDNIRIVNDDVLKVDLHRLIEEEFAGMDAALSKANAVLALDPEEITKKEASDSITQIEAEMSALKVIDAMKDVRSAIEEGQNILNGDLSDYDPQSVEALREAVRAAQEVAESGTQDTEVLLNAAASVRLAISNLKPVEKEVDKTLLELFYQAVKDTAPDSYSEESWLDFVSALEQAQRVLADPEATQDAVDQANEALINAYSNLKPAVNYSALDFEIKLAKDMLAASDEYYSWDMEELEEVLTQAETIRKGASQDEVDQMVKTMRQLRLSIRKKAV